MELKISLLLWSSTATLLLLQSLVASVDSASVFDDRKNYYSPDPHTRTPPSSGGHAIPPPSHHGGGSGSPPAANCGNPPSHHHHTPSHGGYYHSPPTTTPTTPPTTITPPTPPVTITPPTPPVDPGTPSTPPVTTPSPPYPVTPPFTCTYWRNHPTLIWGLVGWWGTVGNAFGITGAGFPGLGANMNLLQALSNTRTDGVGELYREGTAALLNSMAHTRFPYTASQVRDSFVAALSSNKAAANQAKIFKLANGGRRS